jgi:hypothetical protein
MEQGQPIPPLTWNQSLYPMGCTGQPTLTTTATSQSPAGTYPITISTGTFDCPGYSLTVTDSVLEVIPDDGIGARITNDVVYPPGFFSGPTNPALDVTSNSVATLIGDGVTDNTAALNMLLSQYQGASCSVAPTHVTYLYFPPGTYLVSGQINPCGNGWLFFGAGPQRSIIRLAPNSAAFNTGTNTQWLNPSSVMYNANFREFVYNIGFDVGYGNPNAIPLTSEANNVGVFRNVIVWSEDGNCPYAFNLARAYPGPALSKDMAIYGCKIAVWSNQDEYSWVFDRLTTEGQTDSVIKYTSAHYSLEHWLSDSRVTALAQGGTSSAPGTVAILSSALLNGDPSATAITNAAHGNSVYARDVIVTGYGTSEDDMGTGTSIKYTGNLSENWTGDAQCLFCTGTPGSLRLPEIETPVANDPSPATWTKLDTTLANWPDEIANASSTTVYAPPGTYTGTGTINVTIPDTVNHLVMFNALDVSQHPQFVFTVAGSSLTPLVIDGCLYQVCEIDHTGPRTVVIVDTYTRSYQPGPNAGDVFFENALLTNNTQAYSTQFHPGQHVWARQLNAENKMLADFTCAGCTLWLLGYKTENMAGVPVNTPSLTITAGAKAEVFGFFYYPLRPTAPGMAPMYSTDSSLFATGISFNTVSGNQWPIWISETQGGTTKVLNQPGTNSAVLNMYYSNGAK